MSRCKLVIGFSALVFAMSPAFAQTTPTQGTVQPRHVTHPAPRHKMPDMSNVHPDNSADQLNAKELASMQHGSAPAAPTSSMPSKTP